MKAKRVREGACERCGAAATVRYRVQVLGDAWTLVCPACTGLLKRAHPNSYRYGGTWKARKRH